MHYVGRHIGYFDVLFKYPVPTGFSTLGIVFSALDIMYIVLNHIILLFQEIDSPLADCYNEKDFTKSSIVIIHMKYEIRLHPFSCSCQLSFYLLFHLPYLFCFSLM